MNSHHMFLSCFYIVCTSIFIDGELWKDTGRLEEGGAEEGGAEEEGITLGSDTSCSKLISSPALMSIIRCSLSNSES